MPNVSPGPAVSQLRVAPARFVGTNYNVGDRSVMVLVDERWSLMCESLFVEFPESDARAFAKLYEQPASQARTAFTEAKVNRRPRPRGSLSHEDVTCMVIEIQPAEEWS